MSQKVREDNGQILVTTECLCEILGVSRMALKKWTDDGCPKAARGWWNIAEVLRWRGLVGNAGPITADKAKELSLNEQKLYYETKYKQAQAESQDLKNAILRGDYLERNSVIQELQDFFIVLKRSILGISRKVATELLNYVDSSTARKIESMINDILIDALEQMSVDGVYEVPKKKK